MCVLGAVILWLVMFDLRDCALRDAETQASLRLLAEYQLDFALRKDAVDEYVTELEALKKEYPNLWLFNFFIHESQRLRGEMEKGIVIPKE